MISKNGGLIKRFFTSKISYFECIQVNILKLGASIKNVINLGARSGQEEGFFQNPQKFTVFDFLKIAIMFHRFSEKEIVLCMMNT